MTINHNYKSKGDKFDFIKIKKFCCSAELSRERKHKAPNGKTIYFSKCARYLKRP